MEITLPSIASSSRHHTQPPGPSWAFALPPSSTTPIGMNDGNMHQRASGGKTHIFLFVCSTAVPVIDGAHHPPVSALPGPGSNAAGTTQLQLEKCSRAASGVKVGYPSNRKLYDEQRKNTPKRASERDGGGAKRGRTNVLSRNCQLGDIPSNRVLGSLVKAARLWSDG